MPLEFISDDVSKIASWRIIFNSGFQQNLEESYKTINT